MNTTSDAIRGYSSDAQAELESLRAKVDTLMSERVTPALSAVAGQAEHAAHVARESIRDGADRVSEHVRTQPIMSLGLAAVAGFVLASLVRR